jgi:hypothetical protein
MFYIEHSYGADIDGNRGRDIICYEETEEDKEEILEELYPLFLAEEKGEIEIYLYCPFTDDFKGVIINMDDYINDLLEIAVKDEDIVDDLEIQEYLKEVKEKQELLDSLNKVNKGNK